MNSAESNGSDLNEKDVRKVRVMLVDHDPTFLQTVRALLQNHHRDQLDIVGTARSSEECIREAQALVPEVVLMDPDLPDQGGLWAIPLLHLLFPETRVIALTFRDDVASRRAVLAAGGHELVSKAAWKTDLIPTIQRVLKMGHRHPHLASD